MHSERHCAHARPGQHHHRITLGYAALLREELGLAWMGETGQRELRLGHWERYQSRSLAPAHGAAGFSQRMQRQLRASETGLTGRVGSVLRGKDREPAVEQRRIDLVDPFYHDYRDIAPATARGVLQDGCAANHHKRRQPQRTAASPSLGDQFGTDPRRIAERQDERRDFTGLRRPDQL